jgi:bacterioferritin-associated ferredoxin
MPRLYIFAQQVEKILKSGNKEIEIPEGARISAAAAELIKDNKLKIKYIAPGATTEADAPQPQKKPPQRKAGEDQTIKETSVSVRAKRESEAAAGTEISEVLLEDLVNRVIERYKQVKGVKPTGTTAKTAARTGPATAAAGDDDMVICRCEEISKGEIKNVIRDGMQTLNGIKRITRAGMGLCQGQTCQRLVTQILAEELGLSAAEVEPITARGPVRPLRLEVFANS